jgi:hypothetical protein
MIEHCHSYCKGAIVWFLLAFFSGNIIAQPLITSFAPLSGSIGATVTIAGSNFSSTPTNNIVFFGAVRATVSAASSTSLTVTVPRGATYAAISVTTNFLTAYSLQPFILTFPNGSPLSDSSFVLTKTLATTGPYFALVGDLDGDGKVDLITINTHYSNTDSISIFRNTSVPGIINFSLNMQFALAGQNSNMAIGDVNGDGKLDIIVTNYYLSTVTVFTNTTTSGVISFDAGTQFSTQNSPSSIAIADMDADGKPDLVVLSNTIDTITILRNLGIAGTVSFASKANFIVGLVPSSLAISDLDSDGLADIALVSPNSNLVMVYKNISLPGTLNFIGVSQYTLSGSLRKILTTDFDGDGKPDLIITNDSTDNFFVYKNTGTMHSMSFSQIPNIISSPRPIDMQIGDLDGDGKPDIGSIISGVSILSNTSMVGSISFASQVNYPAGSTPLQILLADFDGDGRTDIATTNYFTSSINILRNSGIIAGPQITSFNPDSATEGSTVIIKGINFTSVTAVSFGGKAANSFSVLSDSSLSAVVGTGATGNLVVTSPNGTDSLGGFTFLVGPLPPIVQSFTPDSGNTKSKLTITGQHFTGTTSISFGGTPATSFTVVSDSVIVAVVGDGSTGYVSVTTPIGKDSLAGFTYFISPALITSFFPAAGSPGTQIAIKGENLTGVISVSLGGLPATSFTILSDSSIVAVVGAGASGSVRVSTAYAADSLGGFIFIQGLAAHPNPAIGSVQLYFPASANASQIELADFSGRIILTTMINPTVSQFTLNITGIPGGEYLLIWSNGNSTLKTRLMIAP